MTMPENLDERDVEAPIEDAYEQSIPVVGPVDVDEPVHRGLEVSEYDAVEQAHAVPVDDEER